MSGARAWAASLLVASVSAASLGAQDGVGFRFSAGWQDMAGELGDVFDGAVDADFSVTAPVGPVRVGFGANWASFDVSGQPASFSQVRLQGSVAYVLRGSGRVHPYVEGRFVHRRLRPEDQRYFGGEDEVLRDFVASGYGVEGVLGAQLMLSPRAALDVSGAVSPVSVSPDLSSEGLGDVDSGTSWRAQVGIAWFPTSGR